MKRWLLILCALGYAALLVARPQDASAAVAEALNLCLTRVIPSLFPFLAVTALLLRLGMASWLQGIFAPIIRPLTGLPGICAAPLLAGLLGLALRRFPPEKPGFGTLLTGAAVAAALDKAEATGAPAGAMVLPDGRVITGKTSGTLGAAAALLLNALKALGNIDDQFELISKQVLEPVCHLKTTYLDHRNPRLHTDEVLLTLAISALTNPLADLAKRQLPGLRDSEAHFSVIISEEDLKIFKRLGVRVSCEPKYETKRLYHR